MRDINTQSAHPTQTKPRPANSGNTQPVARPGIGPAYEPKLRLNHALATVVNLSVAVGYLNTALGFNRLMQILEYALKTQTSNETKRLIPTGSAQPPSLFIASMFPFHALQNKRKRRRAKAKANCAVRPLIQTAVQRPSQAGRKSSIKFCTTCSKLASAEKPSFSARLASI